MKASTDIWFGQEWEIGCGASDAKGHAVPMHMLLDRFDRALERTTLHVDDLYRGWWLTSGGRFYRDASGGGSSHNEYCTPEVNHPDELLRHDRAAERLTLAVARETATEAGFGTVHVTKANSCVFNAVSWGSHENYESRAPMPPDPFMAWLASRIVLTGSGGLDPTYPGVRFTISPRTHFIEDKVSAATEWNRALHNVNKAVPLGRRHRVHVIAGDGNRMPLSVWLRFATTALVVRALDEGGGSGQAALNSPLLALRAFALDPTCTCRQSLRNRRPTSVLELQHEFLRIVEQHQASLPGWAGDAMAEWRTTLGLLESAGWRALVGRLDWPTKLAIFERHLARKGWTWEGIAQVNRVVDKAVAQCRKKPAYHRQADPSLAGFLRLVAADLRASGPADAVELLALRAELAEIDARCMQLGDESPFEVLIHGSNRRLPEMPSDPFDLPMPAAGRAATRASLIREHGWRGPGRDRLVAASWTSFWTPTKGLEMPDVAGGVVETSLASGQSHPAALRHAYPRPHESPSTRPVVSPEEEALQEVVGRLYTAIDSGRYEHASDAVRAGFDVACSEGVAPTTLIDFLRSAARISARCQDVETTFRALSELAAIDRPIESAWERSNALVLLGLAGHRDTPDAIRHAQSLVTEARSTRPSGLACWASHVALWHNRCGNPGLAAAILLPALRRGHGYLETSNPVRARFQTQLAEAARLRGRIREACLHLDEAELQCLSPDGRVRFQANRFDYVLTARAKVLADQGRRQEAYQLVSRKIFPLQLTRHMPSSVRSRLLMARLLPARETDRGGRDILHDSVQRERERLPAFADCPVFSKILRHWPAWCDGEHDPEPPPNAETGDTFWGV